MPTLSDAATELATRDLPLLWGRGGSWQVRLRWAVAPLVLLAAVLGRLAGFEFPIVPIFVVAAASPLYNAVFAWFFGRWRTRLEREPQLDLFLTTLQVLADYAAMFLLIHFTGGASSPLAVFLIFHVVIAAIQFRAAEAYQYAALAAGGLWLLLAGEVSGWLPAPAVAFRGQPVYLVDRPVYAALLLLTFSATLFLTAFLVGRIMRQLRRRVEEVARTNEAVERLMADRAQLMLRTAHNLRAPLAAARSMLELVSEDAAGKAGPERAEYLSRIEQRLRALDQTVAELLALAHVRDAGHEAAFEPVDLAELAGYAYRTFQAKAVGKGVRYSVEAAKDLPAVEGHAAMLHQVLDNLVSNAIKYTPAGGEVEVRFSRPSGDGVQIVVRDSGIGIPSNEQDRLFEEFFRATNAKKTTTAGTGLGLALVKQAVELHRGEVAVTSEEGAGTTVVVHLPAVS